MQTNPHIITVHICYSDVPWVPCNLCTDNSTATVLHFYHHPMKV